MSEQQQTELSKHYASIMAEAAAMAVRYVHKEFDFALDFSEETLDEIEDALTSIHSVLVEENEEAIDPKVVVSLSNWFGAYLGEVFIRHHGGEWSIDQRDLDAPTFEVRLGDMGMAFPSRVFHRIMGGNDNNVSDYYHELVEKIEEDSDQEKSDIVVQ